MVKINYLIIFTIFSLSPNIYLWATTLYPSSGVTCTSSTFRCKSGQCIPSNWRCDSNPDCDDGSDETLDCLENINCKPDQFQCKLTKKCLPNGWRCDDEFDCGTSLLFGPDRSDEDPKLCHKGVTCPWNYATCNDELTCIPINKFCDGIGDCPDNSDEWDFCRNSTQTCEQKQCIYKCKQTREGPQCFCPNGERLDGNGCVDADECLYDDSCAQICVNTIGSFYCQCVSGYVKNGTNCQALNVPENEPPSLIFSTQSEIKRVTLEGRLWPGNSTMQLLNSNALEFIHRNHTICYIHHNMTKSAFFCANINDMNQRWEVPVASTILDVGSIQQIALDWVSNNWYFLDDQREIIIVCTQSLLWCNVLIDTDLGKPRTLALDPTKGFLFFTKWGNYPPMLERCKMDGSERKAIVEHKIVYPYGVTVDYPKQEVYWVDTYLDYVERVNYDGGNRKTIIKGRQVQNLYGITVFENRLFVSSWLNNTILEIYKNDQKANKIVGNIKRPFNVYVFHRQRQPDVAQPCRSTDYCDHICIPTWNKNIATGKCLCATGYIRENNKCVIKTPSKFLLIFKRYPLSIAGINIENGNDTMIPLTKIGKPKAMDYDAKTKSIIYADSEVNTIEMASMDSITNVTLLIRNTYCDSLAFDFISRNVYWTSGEKGTISTFKLGNTSISKTLIHDNKISPVYIAVSPIDGIMFWAHWENVSPEKGRIETAFMNGTNRKVFVNTTINWPSDLTIDSITKRLYWCDRYQQNIQSIDLNGNNRRTEIAKLLAPTLGFTLGAQNTIYFIDTLGVLMYHRNGTAKKLFEHGNHKLYGVKLYDPELQQSTNDCVHKSCPELCLPTPNGAVCACSDGYELKNNECIKETNYAPPSQCPPDMFQCVEKKHCIPIAYLCDGIDNCGDGSDESSEVSGPCENVQCTETQMKCDKTTCIVSNWICDGEKDCLDGTDEDPERCKKNCTGLQFKCKVSGRCIPAVWRCDQIEDCGLDDDSDEVDCKVHSCDVHEFTCKNGECIGANYICDSEADCEDGSDEVNCTVCKPGKEFLCEPLNKCLSTSVRCDNRTDCPDGSDELVCGEGIICEEHEFACSNFECIRKEFICDADVDCVDGSDELNCDPAKMHNTTMNKPISCELPNRLCDNNTKCIQYTQLCDNRQDCNDGSDEGAKCSEMHSNTTKLPPLAATCEYPSRLCDNATKCITTEQLCDERSDCMDGSDEGMRCSDMLCDHSYVCSHNCHNAPEGLICSCPPHLHLQADRKHCLETHPCEAWGVCSQTCIPRGSRYKCTCLDGYVMQEDGFTCKSVNNVRPYVIFSNRHELRGIELNTFGLKSFISSLKNTIALDFYYTKNGDMVFWTDVIEDKIFRGTVVGGSLGNIEVVVQTGLSTAEGLAVDWIGQNLYWVESNLDQIEVAKLNGSFRRTLIAGEMESPRAIAVDPRDGYLFWTDWDNYNPRIERSSLAGLDRQIVVYVEQISNSGWPNGLTLDYTTRRIYWIDARSDSIHTTKYDGSDHREVMRNHEMLSHPFAISLFENYVYWTDWRSNSVVRANKWTGGDVIVIQRTLTQPFDIKVMHPSRQPTDGINPCGENNGGCSHLCLLHTNHTYRCDCPHVMRLSNDNKTCIENDKLLLIARNHEIRGVDLQQPYYHTIPTISLPQVHNPAHIEYWAKNKTLFWADSQVKEIKRSGLIMGQLEVLIDTSLHQPTGLAVDWISNLLFVSYSAGIKVCNLYGEYTMNIIDNATIQSITVNPVEGRLFWIKQENPNESMLESSAMDGSSRKTLVGPFYDGGASKSLTIDLETQRLYWVSNLEVFYCNFDGSSKTRLSLPAKATVSAITIYKGSIYYADDDDQSIHVANKTTGEDDTILRNGTSGVLALRIYDPKEQEGHHPCEKNKGGCQHLCLPISPTQFKCRCAIGYNVDPNYSSKCVGVEEFLFYSISWELQGLKLDDTNNTELLGAISKVSSANAIDYIASKDLIFWADSDKGTITKIKRDGTERAFVLDQMEVIDTVPVDWLTGLAIDWIAENIFWCDSKRGVIEVSRLDGSKQHVLLSQDIGKPNTIAVDPIKGYLVWGGGPRMEIATMDGLNRRILIDNVDSIADVALDSDNEYVYFCDSGSNTIERIKYDGKEHTVLLNHSLDNPIALTLLNDKLYWIDKARHGGSIKEAPITNLSDMKILQQDLGSSLKDIQIFSRRKQRGTNACAKKNGGCEQLCLFNGTHPICVCSHGKISSDGKSCESFKSFVMYSRVVSIESIQMVSEKNRQNSPHPSIKNSTILKNAIGLAFSYKHQRLFYSDIQKGSINTVYYNGSDHKVIVERLGSVEGLAYEQIHHSLYWTCNNDATINRINLTESITNASTVETIVRLRIQDKPRGIAIDSCGSRVYWTNWNSHQPSIERAFLSGYRREAIIKTEIRMPNAITIDHKAQKLYWGDARLDKIERCEYDGSKRVVLSKVTPQHPFAMAVYGDFIYWTDWMLHAVLRADKFTGQYVVMLRRDVARPMGIVTVANDTDDCFSNPCAVLNGGCEEICSLTAAGAVQCSCTEGKVLSKDGRCFVSVPTNCTSDSFRCSDGGCVPFQLTCDGIFHCVDQSDEEPGYCGYRSCPLGWFACQNKRCIQQNKTCNGVDDCGDNTDEWHCPCQENQFKCKNGQCIDKSLRCDKDPDCDDQSDEIGCEMPDCKKNHDKDFVNCNFTTACIHYKWICDGENDCWDNSDEANCTNIKRKCGTNEFQCRNGSCISLTLLCDGFMDCHDEINGISSDEENCGGHCKRDQFMCKDSSCIPIEDRCNGIVDCADNSDEDDCVNECHENHFQCKTLECIPLSWECDGSPDCEDGSDETEHCKLRACAADEFRCNSTGRCIMSRWLCDGENDCSDGADEDPAVGCTSQQCSSEDFQCQSGKCIIREYYCDGDRDCDDGSDETSHCYKQCNVNEFRCKNGRCILDLLKCNGNDDCGDNSDEDKDCPNNRANYCKQPGKFLCKNGVCINETLLCNSDNNCGDFSDEERCGINECDAIPSPCAQECIDKIIGYECKCRDGFKLGQNDTHLCEDINECEKRVCSQHCDNEWGKYRCSCISGYVLRKDKKSCRANTTEQASIILANRYYIREMDLRGDSTLIAHNLTNAVALDFDWSTKCIYWSDVTQMGSSIKRLCDYKSNTKKVEMLHAPTLQNPDGLAVDWIGRNLYWCDKGLDTIEVSRLDGRFRRVLYNKGLEEPRAIALDPKRGNMYWTDWGTNPHIGKAGMDASNARILINKNLGWPNALTISFETDELFFADAREDYIAVCDLNGNNLHVIASREKNSAIQLHHVFAIDVWEDYIYWTDWELKSIERCHKYTGENCTSLSAHVHRPMDIRIVHSYKQPVMRNPCLNANCTGLCLLTPNEPFYTCACPENYILAQDGRNCISNCSSSHFECKNSYKCIPFWWKCDTQDDCGDGSDEPNDCPPFNCTPGVYQCKNGQCIHPTDICNGNNDCSDGSDEADCENYTCLNTQFRCKGNGTVQARCISSKLRCNKNVDCPFGEDELDCPPATCPPNQFKCANDKCIPAVWVCDKDNDCSDNSDEQQNCEERTCSAQHFRCNSGRCIPNSWRCDGDPDCADGEDEPKSCSSPGYHTCEPSYFKCKNNKCIPGRWHCDYDNDCGDGSDEIGCVPRNCSESEFRCNDGKCIMGIQKCDGEYQCADLSDETNCTVQCKNNEFQCKNPHVCIFLAWQCDGEADCSDESDEIGCNVDCSEPGQFKCTNGLCINGEWRCDGQNDCEDGSDESNCFNFVCPVGRFRCKNHRCVPISNLCDGYNQCGDNSDEDRNICKKYGICPANQFKCDNGRCLDKSLICNGNNDCEDNSDEIKCNNSTCQWNSCSQICVKAKHNHTSCKCIEGYRHTKNGSCEAEGKTAYLVLAAEADLRLLSPYKTEDPYKIHKTLATAPGYKVDAVDILYGNRQAEAFWIDHQNKRVQSMAIHVSDEDTRPNRDAETAKTILSNLQNPHALSIDWVAKRLYVTDENRILVSTLDGSTTYTLINGNMKKIRDIVVAPKNGLLFWTDWGPPARIETAYMDGDKRRILVKENVLWPTGLSIDYPANRLYWCDPKAMKIETVKFDGSDRQVVWRFEKIKPYKLEIFEDYLYVSTYLKHDILRLNKFGKGNKVYLAQGLTRISDILILHEHKHLKVNNTCDDYCHPSEFCLLTPRSATCKCADGYKKDNFTCKPDVPTPTCPLYCNTGTCKLIQNEGPKCICPPLYTGEYCEHYRCSQYCRNHGRCYIDSQASQSLDSLPPLRCKCPIQFTGERCEKPADFHKDGYCFNGGTYTAEIPLHSYRPCSCKPGYSGPRCRDCETLKCQNGGVCKLDNNNKPNCDCLLGYKGRSCEISMCGPHGKPKITSDGVRCQCMSGYKGEKCEIGKCNVHCQNGGSCHILDDTNEHGCICPNFFVGHRCELDLCESAYPPSGCQAKCTCQNNGKCVNVQGRTLCKCLPNWAGPQCEIPVPGDNPCSGLCENDGVCQWVSLNQPATCYCRSSWTGPRCETILSCENQCENGGTCSITEGITYCQCPSGYRGKKCEIKPSQLTPNESFDKKEQTRSILVPILAALAVIIIVLVTGFLTFDYFTRKRTPFSHERLQENDFNNPMYQDRDAEPFTLDADKSGNFANPVYESVYNGNSSGARDEKAVLLEHSADETPPPSNEEI